MSATRDLLIEGFDYDAWANLRWLEALPRLQDPNHGEEILRHIVSSQRIWLARCLSDDEAPEMPENLAEAITLFSTQWRELVLVSDPTAYVAYQTLTGEKYFSMLEQIARHVINHGTYHRGHLRGLADAQGLTDFPETDLIRYLRELA